MADFAGTYLGLFLFWVAPLISIAVRSMFSCMAVLAFYRGDYPRGVLAILIAGYVLALEVI